MSDRPSPLAMEAQQIIRVGLAAARAAFEAVIAEYPHLVVLPPEATISLKIEVPPPEPTVKAYCACGCGLPEGYHN